MKKFFFISLIFFLSVFSANSQTYIKANAPYWLLGLPNVSVETKLWNNITFNQDLIFSPWQSISGNKMLFSQFIPEIRYYPKEAFRGFYAGAYAAAHIFKMTKWNYLNLDKYQKGWGFGAGLNLGYEVQINDCWLLDTYVSAGWQVSRYVGWRTDGTQYYPLNNSGEWLPYRLGITFAYKLGKQ